MAGLGYSGVELAVDVYYVRVCGEQVFLFLSCPFGRACNQIDFRWVTLFIGQRNL